MKLRIRLGKLKKLIPRPIRDAVDDYKDEQIRRALEKAGRAGDAGDVRRRGYPPGD